ncbi:MAG: tetratricopeptide repeat protein [Candidatus Omnitrophota bacterium]
MVNKQKKKDTSLIFEIDFFEKLIQDNADYVDALIPLAENYTKAGDYENGLRIDKKLVKLRPDDAVIRYNLACSYSILGEIDKALATLRKAIDLGYSDFKFIEQDPDLLNLRKDLRYKTIIACRKSRKGS